MRTVRIASAVVVSAALVGGLAACSKSSSPTAAPAASGAAAAPGKGLDPKAALLASAAVMDKAGSAKITTETTGSASATGTGAMSWKTPQAMELDTNQGGQQVKVEMIDGVIYTSIPAAQAGMAGGKKWMKIDPKTAVPAKGGSADQASGLSATQQLLNPAVILAVDAQAGQVTKVGDEQVDGAPAAHYQSSVPVDALVGAMAGVTDDMKKQITDQLKKQGSTFTTELWINAKGQVVQEKGKGIGATADATTTIKYSDFGTAVNIQAPPAAEVIDLASMLKG